ncbi:MAG: DUF4167 domain-containing protein [Alphaproteobacteria bacterium]
MRQGSHSRRPRTRGNGRRQGGGGRPNGTFDSNGPAGRVRGNAQQVFEKYQGLARDAASSGDSIMAENLLQHAEHYFRVMLASGAATQGRDQTRETGREGGDPDHRAPARSNGNSTNAGNGADSDEDVAELDDETAKDDEGAEAAEAAGEADEEAKRRPRTTRSTGRKGASGKTTAGTSGRGRRRSQSPAQLVADSEAQNSE